jgi:hypothetical protein
LLVIGAVAALLTAATSCSSDSKPSAAPTRPAATVAGAKVTVAEVMADLKAEVAAGPKGKAQTDPSSPLASPKAGTSGTYTPAATAAALTNRILFVLYGQQLRSHRVRIATADKERARRSLCVDTATGQVPSGTSCPPLAAYSAAYRAFQLSLRERELSFGEFLYGRVFEVIRRTEPTLLRQVCLNLVQVTSQSVSDQIQKAIKGGASLAEASKGAAAARKASAIQPGCLFVAVVPSALAKAKKGAFVPIKAQSVLGVAEVTSFRTATKADFAKQPPSSAAAVQKLIRGEVDRSIRRVKVIVDRKYGHWDPTQLTVVAPESSSKDGPTTTSGPSNTGPSPSTTAAPSASSSTPTSAP